MFGWLDTIVQTILDLIPRIETVRPTHAAVKWSASGVPVLWTHENGRWPFRAAHIYWPLLSEVTHFPILRQSFRGGPHRLVLRDGTAVGVEWMVVTEIEDPLAYATLCWDGEDTLDDITAGAVKKVVVQSRDLKELSAHETDVRITRAIRSDLREYGIRVLYAKLTSAAPVRNIALWGSGLAPGGDEE